MKVISTMVLCYICFLFIELSEFASTTTSTKLFNYKVSMVASEQDHGTPAMFEHAASPVWDEARNRLLFVDVWKQNVHLLHYTSGAITTKHIDYGQVHLVTTVTNSKRLLIASRSSLFLMDLESKAASLRPLMAVDFGLPDNVINQAKVDSRGRLWMGTLGLQSGDEVTPDRGSLYSVTKASMYAPFVHLRPVSISGGLAWAPNNSVLYYTDSAAQKIEAFDFDVVKGTISGRRTIIDVTTYGYEAAMPSGITTDIYGNLWVALMFGGAVLHVDPDARHVIYGYKVPVSRCTAVQWGGPRLDELFVTTSRRGADLQQEPLAGAIFTLRETGSAGAPHNHFYMDDADTY